MLKVALGLGGLATVTVIILVGIHMIRVYITASYKFPREMNWITGVLLLFLTIAMGFTGQLLRWDSNGVWSSVVAAENLGRVPLGRTWSPDQLRIQIVNGGNGMPALGGTMTKAELDDLVAFLSSRQ